MTLGAHCSPEVEGILPEAVKQALGLLRHWGIEAVRRPEPRHLSAPVLAEL